MDLAAYILGAWRLRDWQELKEDKPVGFPFGEEAQGQAVFDVSGRMSGLLQRSDWKNTDPQSAEALVAFFAYAGIWRLEEDRLITKVEFASVPGVIGSDQIRVVSRLGDALQLEVLPEFDPSGLGRHQRLIWDRL